MGNVFLTSDLHLGHLGVCKFLNNDGSKLRPWTNVDDMNDAIIKNWNSVVKQDDKVYVLGDVAMREEYLPLMNCLRGSKRLIRGNHDIFPTKEYMKYFKEIYGVRILDDMVLSHIPLHPDSITQRYNINIHGHTHGNHMPGTLHYNVCVEQTDFTPISLEDLKANIEKRKLGRKYLKK